jgi:hypothetical protein
MRTPLLRLPVRTLLGLALGAACAAAACAERPGAALADDAAPATPLAAAFQQEVAHPLAVPAEAAEGYAGALQKALDDAGFHLDAPQFVALVDRSPRVQAVLLFWGGGAATWQLVGASAVSTGLPGRFEHFATPTGVFEHALINPDFRAQGTRNELGIRGYGRKGLRVFDFGWVGAAKGWGDGAVSVMRLQMHATDPDVLEPRLGSAQSKGCVRIAATLNEFLDRHAVLDADYLAAASAGRAPWQLRPDRVPVAGAGRYLVVIESPTAERPAWSPAPAVR